MKTKEKKDNKDSLVNNYHNNLNYNANSSTNSLLQNSLKKKRDKKSSFDIQDKDDITNLNVQIIHSNSKGSTKSDKNKKESNLSNAITCSSENNIILAYDTVEDDCDYYYFYELELKKNKHFDPQYFNNKQMYINPDNRAVLIDWMMNLSSELNFKRETLHLAITLVDISLSKIYPIKTGQLQLVGVTCLEIAAKFEEVLCPNMHLYAYSTGGAYNANDIVLFENNILNVLGWNIKYPTLSQWANLITDRWDVWVTMKFDTCPSVFKYLPYFRYDNTDSKVFRRLFRCIDTAILDTKSFNYDSNKFISALLYLIVGVYTGSFSEEFVIQSIWMKGDLSDLENLYNLNHIMENFFSDFLGFSLNDISEYLIDAALIYSHTSTENSVFPTKASSKEEYLQTQIYYDYLLQSYESIKKIRSENK